MSHSYTATPIYGKKQQRRAVLHYLLAEATTSNCEHINSIDEKILTCRAERERDCVFCVCKRIVIASLSSQIGFLDPPSPLVAHQLHHNNYINNNNDNDSNLP